MATGDEMVRGSVAPPMTDGRSVRGEAAAAAAALVSLLNGPATPGWSVGDLADTADLVADGGGDRWPLVLGDGTVAGVVRRDASVPRGAADDIVLALVRATVALAAAEARAEDAVARAAAADEASRMDPLTGLSNRRAWELALVQEEARHRRSGHRAAVVVVDLDGLKEANDADGHLAGDLLLRRAGQALRAALRDTDFVARIGGDEFAVLAVDWEPPVPESLVGRIAEALAAAEVAASCGGAVPEPGESLLAAFHRADAAMYRAKEQRRTRN
jgi:diguanylate cyclase (GGDEF)-like protein